MGKGGLMTGRTWTWALDERKKIGLAGEGQRRKVERSAENRGKCIGGRRSVTW